MLLLARQLFADEQSTLARITVYWHREGSRRPIGFFKRGSLPKLAVDSYPGALINSASPARTQLIALRRKSRRRVWVE
jgi:hypothetical protein